MEFGREFGMRIVLMVRIRVKIPLPVLILVRSSENTLRIFQRFKIVYLFFFLYLYF